ncbi:MAG: hypothetical protein SO364_04705 [Sodaliphilus sp.]|nr:hypothetical protein [Sodaliphilus sp.]
MKYHVPTGFGFSPKASGFYTFGDATALAGESGVGDVVWMIQAPTTNQKLLCLQRKCGLGVEKALSVDARRGSAPCRWAFPGVLFMIKKMLERNFW